MKAKAEIRDLLDRLIGTRNTLSNNILFIDFTGSHEKAQLLSQMWYWSSRTKIPGGWFCKTYEDWFDEIRIKEHSVRRYVKEFIKSKFLETTFKKFGGVPKLHYRLDRDALIEQLLKFCEADNLQPSQIASVEADNLQPFEADNVIASINIDLEHRIKTDIVEDDDWRSQILSDQLFIEACQMTHKISATDVQTLFDEFMAQKLGLGEATWQSYPKMKNNFFYWVGKRKQYQSTQQKTTHNGTAKPKPANGKLVSEATARQAYAELMHEFGISGGQI